jgi:hypothetical protein
MRRPRSLATLARIGDLTYARTLQHFEPQKEGYCSCPNLRQQARDHRSHGAHLLAVACDQRVRPVPGPALPTIQPLPSL